jgi:hypothetical protein
VSHPPLSLGPAVSSSQLPAATAEPPLLLLLLLLYYTRVYQEK